MNAVVILTSELRSEAEQFIPRVRENIANAQTTDVSAAVEIGKLEAQSAEVTAEIEKLKPEALMSSDKAAAMTTAEKRLALITERLAALRTDILERQQVRMWGLDDLLGRIARHWSLTVPGMIAEVLAPFIQDKSRAATAAQMCDCISVLRFLRYQQSGDPNPIATERNIKRYEQLFSRVLRGQPHLAFDYPDATDATETKTEAAG